MHAAACPFCHKSSLPRTKVRLELGDMVLSETLGGCDMSIVWVIKSQTRPGPIRTPLLSYTVGLSTSTETLCRTQIAFETIIVTEFSDKQNNPSSCENIVYIMANKTKQSMVINKGQKVINGCLLCT